MSSLAFSHTVKGTQFSVGVQFGGDEVVKAKDGAGSATLSMAYAGFRYVQQVRHLANTDRANCSFAEKIIKAIKGEKGIVEATFIYLPGVPGGDIIAKETGVDYFSVPVELGVCPKRKLLVYWL